MKQWRDYLLGRKSGVRQFSQHLFVVFDRETELHKGLGGEIFVEDRLVFSHLGPLFMVGLMGRRGLSLSDISVWEMSELRPESGTITPLSKWLVGTNVTKNLIRRLVRRLRHAVKVAKQMHAAGQV
jgi:hypothetical protein